jgi:hypothetical protein
MTTTSVRCTPTLESISRMIHCEDVPVKLARRVEAILADPEILGGGRTGGRFGRQGAIRSALLSGGL